MKQILYLQDTHDKNGVQNGNSKRIFNCEETEEKEELIGFFIGRRSCASLLSIYSKDRARYRKGDVGS